MIELEKVKAYADNLLVSCNEPSTANALIKELEEVDSSLGIILNKSKSVILAQPFQQEGKTLTEIRGISVSLSTTYLGTPLDVNIHTQKDKTKK